MRWSRLIPLSPRFSPSLVSPPDRRRRWEWDEYVEGMKVIERHAVRLTETRIMPGSHILYLLLMPEAQSVATVRISTSKDYKTIKWAAITPMSLHFLLFLSSETKWTTCERDEDGPNQPKESSILPHSHLVRLVRPHSHLCPFRHLTDPKGTTVGVKWGDVRWRDGSERKRHTT